MKQRTEFIVKNCFCFLLTFFLFDNLQGQTKGNANQLKLKIERADSIILISHEVTFEYGGKPIPDWDKTDTSMNLKKWKQQNPPLLKFLEKGKLNRKIIRECLVLNDSNKINLTKILLRQVVLKNVGYAKCDEPRHSIVIYKNNKESYIDICFGCKRIHTSNDIDFSAFYMDEKKWTDLKDFFKTNGLTKVFIERED